MKLITILLATLFELFSHAEQHTTLPVLGYVTPWNPRGKDLVDQFRSKFDMISPVWYTIHVNKGVYTIKGGPTSSSDVEWYQNLQQGEPIKVTPRFILDEWTQQDYVDLLSNSTLWASLSAPIVAQVKKRGYDGIVFESSATYLLQEPLSTLSSELHSDSLLFIVVLPPIRTLTSTPSALSRTFESQNTMILQSLPGLVKIADYITIMTYDMTGAGGRESPLVGSMFPDDSPLRGAKKASLRIPGPNSHPAWVRENLVAAIEASVGAEMTQVPDLSDPFAGSEGETVLPKVANKLLMGLPLYGYTYPVFWLNKKTGQVVAREPGVRSSAVPILRGPGQPLTVPAMLDLLEQHKATLERDADDFTFFDYLQEAPPGQGVRQGEAVYWRAYMPTRQGMQTSLDTISQVKISLSQQHLSGGVALWEVGQSSAELLSVL